MLYFSFFQSWEQLNNYKCLFIHLLHFTIEAKESSQNANFVLYRIKCWISLCTLFYLYNMFLFYLSVFPGDKTDHHHTTCKTLLIMLHVAYWIVNIIDPVNPTLYGGGGHSVPPPLRFWSLEPSRVIWGTPNVGTIHVWYL